MKLKITTTDISTDLLNDGLKAFASVLNQHFAASGNKIILSEKEENDLNKNEYWETTVEIGWKKVPKPKDFLTITNSK